MLATTHVLVGAAIGRRQRNPAKAFGLGVASHLVMDALPHWGIDVGAPGGRRRFLLVAGADGVVLTAALALLVRRGRPVAEIAGALGGLLLDLDKPAKELGISQLWPDAIHRAHLDIQRWEAPRRWRVDALVAVVALGLVTSRRCDSRRGAPAS